MPRGKGIYRDEPRDKLAHIDDDQPREERDDKPAADDMPTGVQEPPD